MGVGGQRHAQADLPPGKTRYPLCRRLGGLQGPSERVRIRSPDRPARIESLYRLRHPGPPIYMYVYIFIYKPVLLKSLK